MKQNALVAEFTGTAGLVMAIVGSGQLAVRLGADTATTVMMIMMSATISLGIWIKLLGPVSGAHFNPAVTFALALRKSISAGNAALYVVVQLVGAAAGTLLANLMFDQSASQISSATVGSGGLWIAEIIATFGLVTVVLVLSSRKEGNSIAIAVPAWVATAFFFTSSTCFANPAVAFGRIFTQSVTGIAAASVPAYVIAQLVGAALAVFALPLWKAED